MKLQFNSHSEAIQWLQENKDKKVVISITTKKEYRSGAQNRSIHKLFKDISDTLNGFGLDLRTFLKEGIEIPWTQESVKTYIWKPTQKTMFDTKSTTQLKSNEIDQIFEVIARVIRERTGEEIVFPSMESLINKN